MSTPIARPTSAGVVGRKQANHSKLFAERWQENEPGPCRAPGVRGAKRVAPEASAPFSTRKALRRAARSASRPALLPCAGLSAPPGMDAAGTRGARFPDLAGRVQAGEWPAGARGPAPPLRLGEYIMLMRRPRFWQAVAGGVRRARSAVQGGEREAPESPRLPLLTVATEGAYAGGGLRCERRRRRSVPRARGSARLLLLLK